MVWEIILWVLFLFINIALMASNLYQIVCLLDLENDYMNPYESSSRINSVVLPEMVLHCVGSALLLLTGFWFLFLLTLPITIYSSMKYMNKQHLIDVTEVFRYLDAEKKYRIAKLVLYAFVFLLVIIRSAVSGKFSAILEPFYPTSEDLDIDLMFLNFRYLYLLTIKIHCSFFLFARLHD